MINQESSETFKYFPISSAEQNESNEEKKNKKEIKEFPLFVDSHHFHEVHIGAMTAPKKISRSAIRKELLSHQENRGLSKVELKKMVDEIVKLNKEKNKGAAE